MKSKRKSHLEAQPRLLDELIELLQPGARCFLTVDIDGQESVVEGSFNESFFDLSVAIKPDNDGRLSSPAGVLEYSSCEFKSLVVDALVSQKDLHFLEDGVRARGSEALMYQLLGELPAGTEVGFIIPSTTLLSSRNKALRSVLLNEHAVNWIVFLKGGLSNVHWQFQWTFLLITIQGQATGPTRLVDFVGHVPAKWRKEIGRAKDRTAGHIGNTVVIPQSKLGVAPWAFEQWTEDFRKSMKDSEEIGSFVRLEDLVESISRGFPLTLKKEVREKPGDESNGDKDLLDVIEGRQIQVDGLEFSGAKVIQRDSLREAWIAEGGDLLIRGIMTESGTGPKLVAAEIPLGITVAFGSHVLRLRWNAGVPTQSRQLITSWLCSNLGSRVLKAAGVGMQLDIAQLKGLSVPSPSEVILQALDELDELEKWYLRGYSKIRNRRLAIFSAEKYGEVIPEIMESLRQEGEKTAAAELSQTFMYKVTVSYPHPLAIRWEKIHVQDHGGQRLSDTLLCAEHLVQYLAVISLVQLRHLDESEIGHSRLVTGVPNIKNAIQMDWGRAWSTLEDGVNQTAGARNPLQTPFPYLAELKPAILSGKFLAERKLRDLRNRRSHLHAFTFDEEVQLSKEHGGYLEELMSYVSFVADISLVCIVDYSIDLGGKRRATFELLHGSGVVFERKTMEVPKELSRGCLGVLDRGGDFHSLSPWMIYRSCPTCQRPETFILNSKSGEEVTYIAMETGHQLILNAADVGWIGEFESTPNQ